MCTSVVRQQAELFGRIGFHTLEKKCSGQGNFAQLWSEKKLFQARAASCHKQRIHALALQDSRSIPKPTWNLLELALLTREPTCGALLPGLLFGVYADSGQYTCNKYTGSLGYEKEDAAQFAAWGVDLLKYDDCNIPLPAQVCLALDAC